MGVIQSAKAEEAVTRDFVFCRSGSGNYVMGSNTTPAGGIDSGDPSSTDMVVTSVEQGSPAYEAGLRLGMTIHTRRRGSMCVLP